MNGFIVVLASVLCMLPALAESEAPPNPADVVWVTEHYAAAADLVLGNPLAGVDQTVSMVSLRKYPAHQDLEVQVLIAEAASGELSLSFVTLERDSLYDQLIALHSAHRALPIAELAPLVRRRSARLSGRNNQTFLHKALDDLSRICTAVRRSNAMMVDPNLYHLWSRTGAQQMEVRITGGPAARDPLIHWSEDLLRTVARLEATERTARE